MEGVFNLTKVCEGQLCSNLFVSVKLFSVDFSVTQIYKHFMCISKELLVFTLTLVKIVDSM